MRLPCHAAVTRRRRLDGFLVRADASCPRTAAVLIFHPRYASNFSFTCEGLGEWHGKPAWQLRFEERDAKRAMVGLLIGLSSYRLRIRGRAWILADSYEVARLETDLAETIPRIRLRLDHQSVEYGPVRFPKSKVDVVSQLDSPRGQRLRLQIEKDGVRAF